ncbi:hypothetical protein HDU97_004256 [Phlyctochytrium planicorne]|nr:hypothetical protein HDU97_004256 [Phlyctochytrium planicorne]
MSTAICAVPATFIAYAFIPSLGITRTKDRLLNALKVSLVTFFANILGTILYILTVIVAFWPDDPGLDALKSFANNILYFMAAFLFTSLIKGTVNAQKKTTRDFAEKPQQRSSAFRLDFRRLVLASDYLDMEEAFELGFASTPHVFLAVYSITSYYVVVTSGSDIFIRCAVSNIVISLGFQLILGMLRRRQIFRSSSHMQVDLESNKNGLGGKVDHPASTPEQKCAERLETLHEEQEQTKVGAGTMNEKVVPRSISKRLFAKASVKRPIEKLNSNLDYIEEQWNSRATKLFENIKTNSADPRMTLRNDLVDEGARVVSVMFGSYIGLAVMWIICIVFFANDGIFPPVNVFHCTGDLSLRDFGMRFLFLFSIKIAADVILFVVEQRMGVPMHLLRMRYPLSTIFGFAFSSLMHGTVLVSVTRGMANIILHTEPCIPKPIFR